MIHNIERLKIYRLLEVPQSSTAAFCFSIGIQILIIFSVLVFILERYRGQKIEVIMNSLFSVYHSSIRNALKGGYRTAMQKLLLHSAKLIIFVLAFSQWKYYSDYYVHPV